jgi:YfiH family protein
METPALGTPRLTVDSALLDVGILSAFATREGGHSLGEFAGLNISASVGDAPDAVFANRRLLANALGISQLPVLTVRQQHGARVIRADARRPVATDTTTLQLTAPAGITPAAIVPHLGFADVIVSTSPGIALMIGTADCLPLLLCDPATRTIAAAHVGWRGLLAGVVEAALLAVRAEGALGIKALTGSCICGDCYVVGEDLHATFARRVPYAAARSRRGAPTLDLRAAVHAKLVASGVPQVVAADDDCTFESPARWYSRRRDGRTGIQASVVALLC